MLRTLSGLLGMALRASGLKVDGAALGVNGGMLTAMLNALPELVAGPLRQVVEGLGAGTDRTAPRSRASGRGRVVDG